MRTTRILLCLLFMASCLTFAGCEKEFVNETPSQQISLETALASFENAMKSTNDPEYRTSKSELESVYKEKRKTLLLEASKLLLQANGATDENWGKN